MTQEVPNTKLIGKVGYIITLTAICSERTNNKSNDDFLKKQKQKQRLFFFFMLFNKILLWSKLK